MSVKMIGRERVLSVTGKNEGATLEPIRSLRSPTVRDQGEYGQLWINTVSHSGFLLTGKTAAGYLWANYANTSLGNFVAGGSVTATTTVTATTGLIAVAGGLDVQAGGANITGNSGLTGNLLITGSLLVGTNITVAAGTITNTLGDIILTDGTLGIATGDVILQDGDVVVQGAGDGLILPGALKISTGAGVPNPALATAKGCIYINTTAATNATRLYIADAIGSWTAILSVA